MRCVWLTCPLACDDIVNHLSRLVVWEGGSDGTREHLEVFAHLLHEFRVGLSIEIPHDEDGLPAILPESLVYERDGLDAVFCCEGQVCAAHYIFSIIGNQQSALLLASW